MDELNDRRWLTECISNLSSAAKTAGENGDEGLAFDIGVLSRKVAMRLLELDKAELAMLRKQAC